MYVAGAVEMFPDKSEKLTISKSNASLLSKIEQTSSPFDMPISKSKYDTTFLNSDVSETTSTSGWISTEELFKLWVIDTDGVVNIA